MTHIELVSVVARRLGVTQVSVADVLREVAACVAGGLVKGEGVSLSGLGIFRISKRAARTARNPRTGAVIRVKAKKVPAFRPCESLKDQVK